MKDIFGEYGFLIIMALAVVIVVGLVIVFKTPIQQQVTSIISEFSGGIEFPTVP